MTLELTREQLLLQKMIKQFVENEVAPIADELDKTGRFPSETLEKMAKLGLMGINIPKEYGGGGMDDMAKSIVIIELAKKCASTAEMYAVHGLVNEIIMRNCNEAQKKKYLNLACTGKLGAFALTEPGAGSDAGSLQTIAVADGDDYIINGAKCFISNMGPTEGDYAVVIALTDVKKKAHGGMTAFMVDRDTPGFLIGKTEDKMGIRGAAVSEIILDNCRVPKESIIGKVGDGFKIAMSGLDSGRIGIASQAVGLAYGALDEAINYSKQRTQFGKPIYKNQGVSWYIADMATRTEAALGLVYAAIDARARKLPTATKAASMAKYFAAENAVYVTSRAVQIHGGYGYMRDYPVERMYRDARIIPMYEGTSEVQKIVIAKAVLGG